MLHAWAASVLLLVNGQLMGLFSCFSSSSCSTAALSSRSAWVEHELWHAPNSRTPLENSCHR
ncbi:hypothetical protein T4B_9644 [Trichinella pseudospiralis]|uniref:Secreted protein n=2 Tax=Trichinella pseudospiralis TaxID=6337 RepID=A0A0V1ESK9_TRIPS|nr:hypothetical protein T4A_13576 [Trichinella pseudospiralis]KRY83636.1 hypothetical protein T4D_743 [Trichinella pseudospiralis]KRZ25520.1 hypothetical protein T4B_9644 [Trichinella pseudospiralis]KRZ40649.1 hypothetical protein T4C_1091 [Trichinella pseudospiralis]